MRILFDNQIFDIQNYGGVSRYFAELINGLNKSPGYQTIPKRFYSSNKHLQHYGLTQFDLFRDRYKLKGKSRLDNYFRRRQQAIVEKGIESKKFEIFHPTYYDPRFLKNFPETKPFVLTVFDMIHELYFDAHFGKIHYETECKRLLIPRAKHIVAISHNTKHDILRFFPQIPEDRITVIHLGASFSSTEASQGGRSNRSYILFVGKRDYYKNFCWFLETVGPFLLDNNIRLVCGGGGEFNENERKLISDLNLMSSVNYVAVHNDRDLAILYGGAKCFVFPSLYEGFGIPILEAFSCKCPVVLPKSSCFPEIAGDAALFYEAGNQTELRSQLKRIIDEPALATHLQDAGSKRLLLFDWDKTVQQHMDVYQQVNGPKAYSNLVR